MTPRQPARPRYSRYASPTPNVRTFIAFCIVCWGESQATGSAAELARRREEGRTRLELPCPRCGLMLSWDLAELSFEERLR
jgi:hypothetical protein